MKNYLIGIIALTLLQSCVEAPSNGRNSGSKDPVRNEEGDTCTNCVQATPEVYRSQMFRSRGSEQFSLATLQKAIAGGKLPETYYITTKPELNNETQIIRHNQSFKVCGISEEHTTTKKRIEHCKKLNPSNYLWSGKVNGISGEGNWQLIAKTDETSDSVFWLDTTTNLLWSPLLKSQDWEIASGVNAEKTTYCASLDSITKDQVSWRLPNRNEYLQADVNGSRFVLTQTDNTFWTASSDSSDYKNYAWAIRQSTGVLELIDKNMPHEVRCIGVIKK